MRIKSLILLGLLATVLFSCQSNEHTESKKLVGDVVTAEVQQSLTPDDVLKDLMDGNDRFVSGKLIERDLSQQVKNSEAGQYPKAAVLSCLDSRVPVEYILDQGIGDIFVGRIAGNIVDVDMIGSMEFACKVAGSKLVMILGHENCGAVKGSIDDVKLGNLTETLAEIKPAIEMSKDFQGEKSSKNAEYVDYVCKNNVLNTINKIRSQSSTLKEMEDNGEIKIVGGVYDLTDGRITFF